MSQRLQDRTALVTGATSGLGRAIATAYAAEGAHVVVSGRDAERGAEAVAAIRDAGGHADFVAADLGASVAAARELASDAAAALGGHVDVLVNNAGIFPSSASPDVDEATFDAVMAVNVRAPFFLTQALVPGMIGRGGGVVVNVGSWIATLGLSSGSLYAASKATIESFTRGWAAEFGRLGVRVNAVAPGVTLTDGNARNRELLDGVVARYPAGRMGDPAEIAAAAVFLASDEAAYMHGSTLLVDGGALLARPI